MADEAVKARLRARYGDILICDICGQFIDSGTRESCTKYEVLSCNDCKNFVFKTFYILITNRFPVIPSFVCKLRNSGHCKLPPTKLRLRDGRTISQVKLRCDACWLNLCISRFKLPRPIKDIVVTMLPEDLRVLYPKETNTEGNPSISSPEWLKNDNTCEKEETVLTSKTEGELEVTDDTIVNNESTSISEENKTKEEIISPITQDKMDEGFVDESPDNDESVETTKLEGNSS